MTDGNRCKAIIDEALANVSNGSESAMVSLPAPQHTDALSKELKESRKDCGAPTSMSRHSVKA
jgi:hypothetical protein